jgi:hypothetical protein
MTRSIASLSRLKELVLGRVERPKDPQKEDEIAAPDLLTLSQKIQLILEEEVPEELALQRPSNWENISLQSVEIKFKILNRCYREFGFAVPNPLLNSMKCMRDVKLFYLAPPVKLKQFENVDFDNLPPNLSFHKPIPLSGK